jgi:hypothetical protein
MDGTEMYSVREREMEAMGGFKKILVTKEFLS